MCKNIQMITLILINLILVKACVGNDLYQQFLDKQDEFFQNDWNDDDSRNGVNYNVYRRELPRANRLNGNSRYYDANDRQQSLGIANNGE